MRYCMQSPWPKVRHWSVKINPWDWFLGFQMRSSLFFWTPNCKNDISYICTTWRDPTWGWHEQRKRVKWKDEQKGEESNKRKRGAWGHWALGAALKSIPISSAMWANTFLFYTSFWFRHLSSVHENVLKNSLLETKNSYKGITRKFGNISI